MVRIKHRYLLANILYPSQNSTNPQSSDTPNILTIHQPLPPSLTSYDLLKLIRAKIQELYGDYGSGAVSSSLTIKYFSPATSTFILRVSRKDYRIAWGALTFMDCVGWDGDRRDGGRREERRCVVRVVRVSGTIRKAEEEAIRRARELILRGRREQGQKVDALKGILRGERMEEQRDLMVVDESDEDDEMSDG